MGGGGWIHVIVDCLDGDMELHFDVHGLEDIYDGYWRHCYRRLTTAIRITWLSNEQDSYRAP